MSVFDLFRGFFGVPGSSYPDKFRRGLFFNGMNHDGGDDDDDDDDDNDDDYCCGAYEGGTQDPFDEALRFGFSFGPSGMRVEEPQLFGQVFKEMEELFSSLSSWERQPGFGHFGFSATEQPPPQDRLMQGGGEASGNSLRDYMLKSPGGTPPSGAPGTPKYDGTSPFPHSLSPSRPFSKFRDLWKGWPARGEEADMTREDRDLDSRVTSEGLDQILTPTPANKAKTHSFFQSVTVTKVVAPDGTVEERRTVRDSQGNEETTVTRSGGPQDQSGPPSHGVYPPSIGMQDDLSIFSKLFGGFRG